MAKVSGRPPASQGRAAAASAVEPAETGSSKASIPNAITREDFPPRPYGRRAWEIHCETGCGPFEALERARAEEDRLSQYPPSTIARAVRNFRRWFR